MPEQFLTHQPGCHMDRLLAVISKSRTILPEGCIIGTHELWQCSAAVVMAAWISLIKYDTDEIATTTQVLARAWQKLQ